MNTQNQIQELTIHMEGTVPDGGNLRLGVYAKKLDEFRILYDEAKNSIDKNNDKDDLLVTNLTHSSPSATTLRPTGIFGARALDLILDTIKGVNSKSYKLASDQIDFFEKLSNFCKTNFSQFDGIWFSANDEIITSVTKETVEFIDSLQMPGYTSIGEIKGVMEGYNSHPESKYFYVYPLLGGKIKCNFNEFKRHEAARAVDKNIIVRGVLKYHGGSFFPYEIDVNEIEIIDSDENLPKLSDLHIKKSDDNINPVETIKRIRNEW